MNNSNIKSVEDRSIPNSGVTETVIHLTEDAKNKLRFKNEYALMTKKEIRNAKLKKASFFKKLK